MKKIALLMLFLSSIWGYSQVKYYSFAKSTGPYQEFEDGTSLGDESSDFVRFVNPADLKGNSIPSGPGFDIGFDFLFNGVVYDKFAVATDGWISLGTSSLGAIAVNTYSGSTVTPLSKTNSTSNEIWTARIAGFGADLMSQTNASIRFKTIGDVVGQRVLVVQWKGYKKKTSGTNDNFNFQIRLNEGTNTVQIVYGIMTSNSTESTAQVGLRAAPAAAATNFANRKSSTGWNNTVDGTLAADAVMINDLTFPLNGLTFTWTPTICGAVKDLAASSITEKGAILNWGANAPTPDLFEYIISASSAMPLPGTSGTETISPTATVANLNVNTVYNVFIRTKCGSQFAPWVLAGTFKTLCSEADVFFEDFDSYTYNPLKLTLPDCWDKTGTTGPVAASHLNSGITANGGGSSSISVPNSLLLIGRTDGSNASVAYAIMPPVSNLQAGTHRLKFKAYGTQHSAPLDIGYFNGPGNTGTFTVLETKNMPGVQPKDALEYTYSAASGLIPSGVKNLVFRNNGAGPGTVNLNAYIDNVVWEPNPTCPDVKAVVANGFTSTTMNLSWTKGGSETQWQYVYGPTNVQNPNTLTAKDVSSASITVSGLTPATTYKIWIRSNCSGDFGAWIGPVIFSTTCPPATKFMESFDANTSLPACWTRVGTKGIVGISSAEATGAPSGPNALVLNGGPADIAMITLPPVSNAAAGTHQLKFNMKVSAADSKIEIGYLDDMSDLSSWHFLQTVTSGNTASYSSFTLVFGSAPKSPYLAFRSLGNTGNIYLDDVSWEPVPTCPDVSGIAIATTTGTTASLTWTEGGTEDAWQYAIGAPTLANPFSLTPIDVAPTLIPLTVAIGNLTPVTTYRVWMRSKCENNNFGSWIGPIDFTTTCSTITDFSQNFDAASPDLPTCWKKVGSYPNVSVFVTPSGGVVSAPNILVIGGASPGAPAICGLPPVSNMGAGTHKLSFSVRSSVPGSVFEVGFMVNPSDPTSFSSQYSFEGTSAFQSHTVEFGTDLTAEVLAFRNANEGGSLNIDNVVWEPIPLCADAKNLISTGVTDISISIDWEAGASETKWQYAIGPVTLANPTTLTPVDVSGTSAATIGNRTSATSYKIWVRSKCSLNGYGLWVGPIIVNTVCPTVGTFTQNFDTSTDMPSCWNIVGNGGSAYVGAVGAASGANGLVLYSASIASQPIVSVPPVTTASMGDHVLKFSYKATAIGSVLEVGYLTNTSNAASFVPFKTIVTDSTADFKTVSVSLGSNPLSNVLAFRNDGSVTSFIYIDNVSWEGPLGINPFDDANFSYYPNPVKDMLNLSFNEEMNNVSVVNLLGQQVISTTLNSNHGKIDMSGLSRGAYLVKVTVGNQYKTIKVIKE